VDKPRRGEEAPEARLLADPRATEPLLRLIGLIQAREDNQRAAEEARQADNWGAEALEEEPEGPEGPEEPAGEG
jgi:hypothetical protein